MRRRRCGAIRAARAGGRARRRRRQRRRRRALADARSAARPAARPRRRLPLVARSLKTSNCRTTDAAPAPPAPPRRSDVAKAPPPGAGSANEALAAAFAELAALYREVSSDNFKGAAFAKVAAAVAAKESKIGASKDMKGVPGVGKSSLAKIDEWLATGTMGALEELRAAKGGGGPSAPPPTKGEAMAAKFI